MIEPNLSVMLEGLTLISLWLILGAASLMVLRLRKSLISELTSLVNSKESSLIQLVEDSEAKAKSFGEGLLEKGFQKFDGLVGQQREEFNGWLKESLPGLADQLVKQPLKEILESSYFSGLGKLSGEVRKNKALVNQAAEAVLPEGAIALRDTIIKQFPSTKGLLKDPSKLISIANMLGIDPADFLKQGGSNGSNSTGGKTW